MKAEGDSEIPGETDEARQSKSARKREAASLQELGVELAGLPDPEIAALDLPDKLFAALRDLKRLPSHGAQVRQRQYIGKLMRDIDPAPVLELKQKLPDLRGRAAAQVPVTVDLAAQAEDEPAPKSGGSKAVRGSRKTSASTRKTSPKKAAKSAGKKRRAV